MSKNLNLENFIELCKQKDLCYRVSSNKQFITINLTSSWKCKNCGSFYKNDYNNGLCEECYYLNLKSDKNE